MLRTAAVSVGLGLIFACGGLGQGTVGGAKPAPPAAVTPAATPVPEVRVVVSVPDQKLAILVNGKVSRSYKVSTSRYGEGDALRSWRTPLGHLEVAHKIGATAPVGAVFKGRQLTGEVLAPNAPGRDPVVSRIIWLRGMEINNRRAYERCIYIHGTPQESFLGRKASFGCIRMRMADVVEVFNWINIGTDVAIVEKPMTQAVRDLHGELKEVLARTAVAKISAVQPGTNTASLRTASLRTGSVRSASVRTASVH